MKIFEDYFSELQAGMVSICLDYAEENKAEGYTVNRVYIYISCETVGKSTVLEPVFSFRVNGKWMSHADINGSSGDDDDGVPDEQQDLALDLLTGKIMELRKICQQYDKPMPTEMKLTYDVEKSSLDAAYRYDPVLVAGKKVKTTYRLATEWFAQLEKGK